MHNESDNSQCSTHSSDLTIIQSVWDYMKKQKKTKTLRNLPEKQCRSVLTTKAVLNAKVGQTKC